MHIKTHYFSSFSVYFKKILRISFSGREKSSANAKSIDGALVYLFRNYFPMKALTSFSMPGAVKPKISRSSFAGPE